MIWHQQNPVWNHLVAIRCQILQFFPPAVRGCFTPLELQSILYAFWIKRSPPRSTSALIKSSSWQWQSPCWTSPHSKCSILMTRNTPATADTHTGPWEHGCSATTMGCARIPSYFAFFSILHQQPLQKTNTHCKASERQSIGKWLR